MRLMLLRTLTLPAAAAALAAAAFAGNAGATQPKPVAYQCADKTSFKADFVQRPGHVVLIMGKLDAIVLPAVKSASGNKYQRGHLLFWSKGDTARLRLSDMGKETTCQVVK